MVLAFIVVFSFAGMALAHTLEVVGDGEKQEITTGRTMDDYVKELLSLTGADKAGDVISPERNEVKYLFVPLYKDGELIGYGTWVNTLIYSHPEDIIAVIAKEDSEPAKIVKWKALDANDHHPEMKDEEYISRYYGMTLETSFDPEVDVISGSTISCQTFFFEMKNALLVFEKFGPDVEE